MSLKASKNPSKIDDIVDFWLELMMILIFLTGAGVLDDILDGPHMLCRSSVSNLVEIV